MTRRCRRTGRVAAVLGVLACLAAGGCTGGSTRDGGAGVGGPGGGQSPSAPSASGRRLALVVGNDAYAGVSPLRNAVNDARSVASALEEVGFAVERLENATQERLEESLAAFAGSLRSDDVALFYFAGHGMEVGRVNYLIPTDFDAVNEAGVRFDALSALEVQDMLGHARVAMLVFDACRNNPYRGFRSSGGGLAPMEARGTLIAYAAGAGELAADAAPGASNGLFTSKFVEALDEPGLTASELFRRVRREVHAASNEAQWPAVYDDLLADFVFRPDRVDDPGPVADSDDPGGALVGTTVDDDGGAISGTIIEVWSEELVGAPGETDGGLTYSDDAGRYVIDNLRPGTYTVTFLSPGFSTLRYENLALVADGTRELDAVLAVGSVEEAVTVRETGVFDYDAPSRGVPRRIAVTPTFRGVIAGTLVDGTGAALSGGALVEAASGELTEVPGDSHWREVRADAVGRYSITNLRPGTYMVTVRAPGFVDVVYENVVLGAGVTLQLDAALGQGEGRVQQDYLTTTVTAPSGCSDDLGRVGSGVGPVSVTGAWDGTCPSLAVDADARYYSFTLTEPGAVTVDLTSSTTDTWLAFLRGAGVGMLGLVGEDYVDRLTSFLVAGEYTIMVGLLTEAGILDIEETAPFVLTVSTGAPSGCSQHLRGGPEPTIVRRGDWDGTCRSVHYDDGRYGRYYSFRVTDSGLVTVDLASASADTWLALRRGTGTGGELLEEDDDGGGWNARITRHLPAGWYTIEATTLVGGEPGPFTLQVYFHP